MREADEVIQGNIPSSVNLPLSSLEKSLDVHPDDFFKSFGFRKPKPDQSIIFYCRSGKRSETAMGIAKLKGFNKWVCNAYTTNAELRACFLQIAMYVDKHPFLSLAMQLDSEIIKDLG